MAANKTSFMTKRRPYSEFVSAGRSERVFKRMLRLSYLSPSIVHAILEGDEPPSLTCRGLHRVSSIPIVWDEQRRFFQFD